MKGDVKVVVNGSSGHIVFDESSLIKRIRIKHVPKDWKPVYRSTDPDVAVCSSGGYVAPKGNGTATIYTRIGNTYLICHVTVEGFK